MKMYVVKLHIYLRNSWHKRKKRGKYGQSQQGFLTYHIIVQTEHYHYFNGHGGKQRNPWDPANLRAERINIWTHP